MFCTVCAVHCYSNAAARVWQHKPRQSAQAQLCSSHGKRDVAVKTCVSADSDSVCVCACVYFCVRVRCVCAHCWQRGPESPIAFKQPTAVTRTRESQIQHTHRHPSHATHICCVHVNVSNVGLHESTTHTHTHREINEWFVFLAASSLFWPCVHTVILAGLCC